jgi:hypothetical protein
MWCGGCYTSNPDDGFFVQERESFITSDMDVNDEERLITVWRHHRQPATEFRVGRDGDHLMIPFECDLCVFRKLKTRSPRTDFPPDKRLLAVIRRANLDAFWSRASSTVRGNRDKVKASLDLLSSVGLSGPYEAVGTFPSFDHCGYEVAITMLLASQRPGKYAKGHSQWDTIRKYRTSYANYVKASPQGNQQILAFGDDRGQVRELQRTSVFLFGFLDSSLDADDAWVKIGGRTKD